MYRRLISAFLIGVSLLSGCATTSDTHFLEKVTIPSQNETPSMEGVAVDAKQRLIWMPVKSTSENPNHRLLCAEPSPDVMSALSGSLSTTLKSNIAGKGDIDVNLQRIIAESITNIGKRTATVQLLRDSLYRACEAHANGMLNEFGYALLLSKIDNLMVQLVSIEALERIASTTMHPNNAQGTNMSPASIANMAEARAALLGAIRDINKTSHGSSTIVGACMVYFSQREQELTAHNLSNKNPDVPAIAHFCRAFITSQVRKDNK